MWLATKHGFYSVVEKTPGVFHLRARLKGDLENLRRLVEERHGVILPAIETWPRADYRFRIVTDEDGKTAALIALINAINYSNFKSEIAATPGQREKLGAYHRVWHEMAALQP